MLYLALSFSFIFIYVVLVVIAMRGVRGIYFYDEKNVEKLRREFRKPAVAERYEQHLIQNPHDVERRFRLLDRYYFGLSADEKADYQSMRPHILWFISNRPDFDGPWMNWGIALSMTTPVYSEFVEIAVRPLQKLARDNPDDTETLRNVAFFIKFFEKKFAFGCWKRVYDVNRLDPFVIREFAHASNMVEEYELASRLFLEFFDIPWSMDDFARIRRVQRKFPWGFPRPLFYALLYLISLRDWKPADRDIGDLLYFIKILKRQGDFELLSKWTEHLENILNVGVSLTEYRPTVYDAYTTLAVIESQRKDWDKVQRHIEKILEGSENIPINENFWLVDEPLMSALAKSGKLTMARNFWSRRSQDQNVSNENLEKARIILEG